MGFFSWGKKDVVDLTGDYKRTPSKKDSGDSTVRGEGDAMRLLGGLANAGSSDEDDSEYSEGGSSESIEEKRRKLAKRLIDMTNRIDDLSNQVYHLQQRLEVLEKKNKTEFLN